jgi:hypothetical protein
VPAAAIAAAIKIGRSGNDREAGIYVALVFVLVVNFAAALFYAMMSGGGV